MQNKPFVAKKTLLKLIEFVIPLILLTWAVIRIILYFISATERNYIFLAVLTLAFANVVLLLYRIIDYIRGGLVAISADDKGVYFFAKKQIFIPYAQITRCEYRNNRSRRTRMSYGSIYITADEITYKIPFVKNVSSACNSLAALMEHGKSEQKNPDGNDSGLTF